GNDLACGETQHLSRSDLLSRTVQEAPRRKAGASGRQGEEQRAEPGRKRCAHPGAVREAFDLASNTVFSQASPALRHHTAELSAKVKDEITSIASRHPDYGN